MSVLNQLYVRGVLPAFEPKYRGLAARLNNLEAIEGRSVEENLREQWSSLMRLLQHAYDTSPFYRKRFTDANMLPSDIRSPEDLQGLPTLTRSDIRDHLDQLRSSRYRPQELLQSYTGGTTDPPVLFERDANSVKEKTAVQWRFNYWAGFRPGDKILYLWGAQQDYAAKPSWRWRLYDHVLMRRSWAPTSAFNPETLERYRTMINRLKPRILFGYSTPLTLFCEYLRDCGLPFHRPKAVIHTAEMLLPEHRRIIENTLECGVFEHYGAREFGMIGAECECHSGIHVSPFAAYVEYIPLSDKAGGENLCELIITDLLNYGMPLIRYKVNDCAIVDSGDVCSCGRGYPVVRRFVGRATDIFQLPDGTLMPGISVHQLMMNCPGFNKIQVVQYSPTDFRLRYVRAREFRETDMQHLRERISRFFPQGLQWTLEEVPEIERERSGKTRYCISYVQRSSSVGVGRG